MGQALASPQMHTEMGIAAALGDSSNAEIPSGGCGGVFGTRSIHFLVMKGCYKFSDNFWGSADLQSVACPSSLTHLQKVVEQLVPSSSSTAVQPG